jgi:hypothetical protein
MARKEGREGGISRLTKIEKCGRGGQALCGGRRHGRQITGMLKSTGIDSRRSKRRCKASRLHSGDDQNRTIVRPVLQWMVNLLCVPYIITSQTKKCLTACMRSYGKIVNTLPALSQIASGLRKKIKQLEELIETENCRESGPWR